MCCALKYLWLLSVIFVCLRSFVCLRFSVALVVLVNHQQKKFEERIKDPVENETVEVVNTVSFSIVIDSEKMKQFGFNCRNSFQFPLRLRRQNLSNSDRLQNGAKLPCHLPCLNIWRTDEWWFESMWTVAVVAVLPRIELSLYHCGLSSAISALDLLAKNISSAVLSASIPRIELYMLSRSTLCLHYELRTCIWTSGRRRDFLLVPSASKALLRLALCLKSDRSAVLDLH